MISRGWGSLGVMLLVGGCIPPAAPPSEVTSTPQTAEAPVTNAEPYLAPRYEDVLDQPAVWELRPVVPNARDVKKSSYTVAAGETLSAISLKTGASVTSLAQENGLAQPYVLKAGQVLRVPGGRFHKISAGETGIAIARAYGVSWSDLIAANMLSDPFVLKVGQSLRIPISETMPEATDPMEARAAAFKLNLEDILTGGEPAQTVASAQTPSPVRPSAPTTPVKTPSQFSGPFGWPVAGRVISRFGPAGEGLVNQGIEIRTPAGAQVVASGDGVVAFVGDNVSGYGGMILVRHGSGWTSAYGRVATAHVKRGQAVKRGDLLATTGTGSLPQLHFQLRKGQSPVDPLKQLPTRN